MARTCARCRSLSARRGCGASCGGAPITSFAEAVSVEGRGKALFAAVEQHDLEGIVAKRKSDPYRRGVHWWKIKNPAYSQCVGRHELFNGEKRHHRLEPGLAGHSHGDGM